MKKALKISLTAFFVATLWVQAFHRHHVHEGGVFAPHIDCVVCAWAQGSHVSYVSAAPAFGKDALSAQRVAAASDLYFPHRSHSSSLSRAPPLA